MIELVARVVPWMISPISAAATPELRRMERTPAITPCSGAPDVVSTLMVVRSPACSSARSVMVPPISTARRARFIQGLVAAAGSALNRATGGVARPLPVSHTASRQRWNELRLGIPREQDPGIRRYFCDEAVDR